LKSGWDRDMLAIELQGLIAVGFDMELTGFELGEIEVILDGAAEKTADADRADDDLPDENGGPAISRSGDIWQLGSHLLVCGDARDRAAYRAVLGDDQANAVMTDPPYNVKIEGHVSGLGTTKHKEFAFASGEMSEQEFTAFLTSFLQATVAHLRPGGILFCFMDWRHLGELLAAGRACELELKNLCVWCKDNGGMGTFYRSQHELVLVFKAPGGAHTNTFELGQHGRYRTNVWQYAGVNTFRNGRGEELAMHPTVKPVALVADALKDVTRHNEVVLDPFSGSGTTLIAAEKTGRRGRAIEFEPRYVDVAVRRWQIFTGKQATLASTGQTFDDVLDERLNQDSEVLQHCAGATGSGERGDGPISGLPSCCGE
jgi:DNA modification methylase